MSTINKCLFPVAGYGTRFLPVTKVIPKEMLPILTKPLIQYGVEEAMSAGMTTIAMVTSKHKQAIEDYFKPHSDIEASINGTIKEVLLDEVNYVSKRCDFAYIEQQQMLGHWHLFNRHNATIRMLFINLSHLLKYRITVISTKIVRQNNGKRFIANEWLACINSVP